MIYSSGFGSLIESDKGLDVVIAHAQTRYPEWQERGDSASAPVGTHIDIPAEAKKRRMVDIDYQMVTMLRRQLTSMF